MFKLVKQRRVWWPVTFPLPADGGETVEGSLELHFTVLDEEQFSLFSEKANKIQLGADGNVPATIDASTDLVLEVAADWRGVLLENGEPAPFNRDNLRELIKQPGVLMALLMGFRDCRTGQGRAREGN
jgi:hypothetical protein